MKKIIKFIVDSDLLHPDQKEKKKIEKIIDSFKISSEEIETEVWINKNHNDKITIDRKDFEEELKEVLYYDLISRRAFLGLLQWFDEYGDENKILEKENLEMKYEYKILDIDEYITDDVLEKKFNRISNEDWRLKCVMNLPSEMKPYNRQLIFERERKEI